MLKIKNLSLAYEDQPVLNAINLNFEAGQIYGLIGPNGAGKSTLLKACCGLLSPDEGAVYFNERNLNDDLYWVKKHVAYVPENAVLLPYLSGREFLKMIAGLYGLEDAETRMAEFANLLDIEDMLDDLTGTYSHGMLQKLSLAAGLLPDPSLILIDEALNGMDSLALERVKVYLAEQARQGKHVIVSSHHIELIAGWCERIYVIHRGRILDTPLQGDNPKKLLTAYLQMLD